VVGGVYPRELMRSKLLAVAVALAALGCPAPAPECPPVDECEQAPAVVSPPRDPPMTAAPQRVVATMGRTREFEVRGDRAWLGGEQVKLWGIRWGNALLSQAVTERHVRNLDNLAAHGINLVGVYVQGSNGGWPNVDAALDGYAPDGELNPAVATRLEWLIREADARGMVVMVGLFSPRKDQNLEGEAAARKAIEQTIGFLKEHELRNVFIDLVHEYDHERVELELFREPNGAEKKQRMTEWAHAIDPTIEIGVCPTEDSDTAVEYPGMDLTLIQKEMDVPSTGFVANVEMQRHDGYDNDGKFEPEEFDIMRGYFERYHAADNAALLFHSGFTQGVTGRSGTGPNPEKGGSGRSEDDRGVAFYFDWVAEHVGRWEYPRHVST
jgi:hypothetical protein